MPPRNLTESPNRFGLVDCFRRSIHASNGSEQPANGSTFGGSCDRAFAAHNIRQDPRDSAPIQIGDLRIEKQIGAGGMGIVPLARQRRLSKCSGRTESERRWPNVAARYLACEIVTNLWRSHCIFTMIRCVQWSRLRDGSLQYQPITSIPADHFQNIR